VLVGQVDDGLGRLGADPDAGQVIEVTAADLRPPGLQGGGRGAGPGQPGDLMPGGEQLIDVAEPIQPEAPVTKTRMASLRLGGRRDLPG